MTGRLQSRTSIGVQTAVTGEEPHSVAGLGMPGSPRRSGRAAGVLRPRPRPAGVRPARVHGRLSRQRRAPRLCGRTNRWRACSLSNALAAAGDTLLRFKGGEYEFRAVVGGSLVTGATEAIERVQRTSSHYAQRPGPDLLAARPDADLARRLVAPERLRAQERTSLALGL